MFSTAKEIRNIDPNDVYTAYHAPRYSSLIKFLGKHMDKRKKVLDIGSSKLTELLSKSFEVNVDTLGFQCDGPSKTGYHHQFDLNNAQFKDKWLNPIGKYDVIVMAEVIEHLYTSPTLVLAFLKSVLTSG